VALGFNINADKARAAAPAEPAEALTTEEELCQAIVRNLRLNQPKAALAAAADLTNIIARGHNLTGGAWT
jgi:hypothetical protein